MPDNFPDRYWYNTGLAGFLWACLLSPLSLLFALLSASRRLAYRAGLLSRYQADVPVIVVGNISVGGTGKTPVVIALIEKLQQQGYTPGVVSRGYGGATDSYPLLVSADIAITESGDEPGLIARRTDCPVVVDPKRSRALAWLVQNTDVDIVISDDGLQHYAMARNAEIVVVDAQRRFGNGWLLPSGPLRERRTRLRSVDAVMINGGGDAEASFELVQSDVVAISTAERLALDSFSGRAVHAVAGIGHPERFFTQLEAKGLEVHRHAFPDHYAYVAADLQFGDDLPVLMTEKDAVKCTAFAKSNYWSVPVSAAFNENAEVAINALIEQLDIGK